MCSERYREVKKSFCEFDNSWEEEVERLKDDIKKAEKKVKRSEHRRLIDKAKFSKEYDRSDESLMDLCPSPTTPHAFLSSHSAHKHLVNTQRMPRDTRWVSPSVSNARQLRRDLFQDPFSSCPESSFDIDCGSSVISLDFGLVSPHRNWCSPPQRIERAQNREWSSPHRVIDRPNPENSPGNWISMKESCLPLRHSPALGVKCQPEQEVFPRPDPGQRPPSQATYVVPEPTKSEESLPKTSQPTRKTSVLLDYEPERVVFAKSRTGGSGEPPNEKIRRVVDSSGHVVKVSLLGDFEAPGFGKSHEKAGEGAEKETVEGSDKAVRTNKTTKISCKLSPPAVKLQPKKMKKEEPREESRTEPAGNAVKETTKTGEKGNEKAEVTASEDKAEDIGKSTRKMIEDLEEILRPSNRDADKITSSSLKEKSTDAKPKLKRPKPCSKAVEEKPVEMPEKRKRNVDPKAVQEYIKNQKQKRMEQVKTEKKTKDAEREARKKKLEELRIKTLKLATQSKKKKQFEPAVKVDEPGTEDDVTVSLGLKQTKPKVSYNESVSKLKKKGQQKPQPNQNDSETTELPAEKFENEEDGEKTLQDVETIAPENKPEPETELEKPEDALEKKPSSDLNATLKKLAETLHLKLEMKEKQLRSRPVSLASKSVKDPLSQVPSQETLRSVKSAPEENRQLVTVDLETIQTLKSDIKKISENFKVLHEIILDKAELSGKGTAKKSSVGKPEVCCSREEPKEVPEWLKSVVVPRPYPYNVLTAFQQKMNLKVAKTPSSVSQSSSTFAEPISNKYESEFEALSIPSDRLRSRKEMWKGTSSEANYYSMKEDSGSEFSSSILDSEKRSWRSGEVRKQSLCGSESTGGGSLHSSSTTTEISSSIHPGSSRGVSSSQSKSSVGRENLELVTPDLKLIRNELHQDKFNDYAKNLNVVEETCKVVEPEELNNSEKSCRDQKSDSTIAELIDNLTENERSVKSTNEKRENVVRRTEGSSLVRRSFFQPEMLHLQFQAELTLLETFQKSLSHFLEAERMKTLSEVNKIVYEKAINTEKCVEKEDQGVQTSYLKGSSERTTSEDSDSVKTEIAVEESPRTEKAESTKTSEKPMSSSGESVKSEKDQEKEMESPDLSSNQMGISFQMLNRMMKDEELRSEHQLALIRLREKTSNEKVKAELTFLEMKKRALKERGGDVEQNISAIKKKQRGILLKYQSEKEEIERLKKMHRIASEERKIMIKQQKQIQQMQMSTNDMIIKLRKRERSPSKKIPLKAKALRSSDSQSEIPEDIPAVSDSVLSESAEESARQSSCTDDLDLSSRSNISEEEEGESLRRNARTFQSKMSYSAENFKTKKSLLEVEKYPRKRHSVEELLSWTRRLEEKESHLKELEAQAMSAANRAKRLKSLKSAKTSMKDRSTSPFQFQDSGKTISEVSPSDGTEVQKSPSISETVESNLQTEVTKTEAVVEKIQSSASEDIPEQFSKKVSTSRTTEYCSESFESPSSSETPKPKPELTRLKSLNGSNRGIAIKLSLSPRMQSPRRRYSSGSDDSVNMSHTETASEQSDLESRIAALHEQLRKRKLEAERLRREQKKAQRERLKVKEQSLLKQIQAYDAYIQKKKEELEQEYERSTPTVMKPVIKQPKVAEKSFLRRQEHVVASDSEKALPFSWQERKNRDETVEKVVESESEVVEQVKDTSESGREESESIREEIESKAEEVEEEEEKSAVAVSVAEVESSAKENSSAIKSSLSESLVEQNDSQSESEDQSISIKTTLHSPERETERGDTIPTGTCEEDSQNKQSLDEDVYQFDSFESDVEEKVIAVSENLAESAEISEVGTEVPSESVEVAEEEEEREEEKEKEEEVTMSEVCQTLEEVEEEEEDEGKAEKAEKIADSIIVGLILESLNVFCSKKAAAERKLAEESKLSLEALSSYLAKEIISEAVDDMLQIYNRRMTSEEAPAPPDRITSEVRKRVSEIMSQVGLTRPQDRPQEITTTTFDVSPAATSPEGEDALEREKFLQTLTLSKDDGEQRFPEGEEETQDEFKAETYGQQWIDDDFGLSRTRREAEELRLQQLQIEQEIQQLQAQQEQVPYFYLREIPNKPPPPYTPPGKPLAEIPTSECEIAAVTANAVRILAEEMSKGIRIADIEPSWAYYEDAASEHLKCYKFFLFDLAKHIVAELVEQQESKREVLPWMRTREHLARYKYRNLERTFECLSDFVQRQVSILFGFGKKVSKESVIVKWIKKKRDHVDEILVGESQEEEGQWTQYDEDQVTVKNEVTLAILDSLLEDTAQIMKSIVGNKRKGKSRSLGHEVGAGGSG